MNDVRSGTNLNCLQQCCRRLVPLFCFVPLLRCVRPCRRLAKSPIASVRLRTPLCASTTLCSWRSWPVKKKQQHKKTLVLRVFKCFSLCTNSLESIRIAARPRRQAHRDRWRSHGQWYVCLDACAGLANHLQSNVWRCAPARIASISPRETHVARSLVQFACADTAHSAHERQTRGLCFRKPSAVDVVC